VGVEPLEIKERDRFQCQILKRILSSMVQRMQELTLGIIALRPMSMAPRVTFKDLRAEARRRLGNSLR
jgi:hypothetical protein